MVEIKTSDLGHSRLAPASVNGLNRFCRAKAWHKPQEKLFSCTGRTTLCKGVEKRRSAGPSLQQAWFASASVHDQPRSSSCNSFCQAVTCDSARPAEHCSLLTQHACGIFTPHALPVLCHTLTQRNGSRSETSRQTLGLHFPMPTRRCYPPPALLSSPAPSEPHFCPHSAVCARSQMHFWRLC